MANSYDSWNCSPSGPLTSCLGKPNKQLLLSPPLFPGSQGHTNPPRLGGGSHANSYALSWWCISAKIADRAGWVWFAGCLSSSLGTGWGLCVSGWSKTTTLSCGEGASWGGFGICIKSFHKHARQGGDLCLTMRACSINYMSLLTFWKVAGAIPKPPPHDSD